MDTKQILKDLSQMCCAKKNFACLPANYLPKKILRRPFYLVVNTSPSFDPPGEHWVCMYLPKKSSEKIEYFDSFGFPATNKYFIKFLKNNCEQYNYNPVQIQSNISNLCGEFCVMFLHARCKDKMNLQEFVKQFDREKLQLNDSKVIGLYRKMHRRNKRARAKMTQFGRGSYSNIVCNQTCVPRDQFKQTRKTKFV